ncbi:MAG: S-layer homology domain-containing protein [Clostridia bacterium]|nr:S-layer homology domain-containing protein [Clostridia bacterium]
MKNRFLALLLVFLVLFSTFSLVYAADSSDTVVDYESAKFLDYLGIMQLLEEDEYSKYMTREDFAYSVAVMMGLSGTTDKRYYTDLRSEGFAFGYINNLADAGVLSKSGNASFRPFDYVTYDEAHKMLVSALGYSLVAETKGGYPVGYNNIAKTIGLGDYDRSGNVTWAAAVDMFYNSLKAVPYEISSISSDGIRYSESDVCYANIRYNLRCFEGTVRATHYGNIDDNAVLDEKYVKIDDTLYTVNENIDERNILGSYGEIFCTDVDGVAEVVYLKDIERTEDLTIDITLFKSYDNNAVEYYKSEDSSKTSSVQVLNSTIVYNGLPLRSKIRETLASLNKGTITLKDTNDDRKYDVIDIKDYKNFYVKFVDGDKLYNSLKSDDEIDLKSAESVSVEKNGDPVSQNEIAAETSISLAASLDRSVIDIIINEAITAVYTANHGDEIQADGETYELDGTYIDMFLKDAKLGETYKFWIDFMGNIAYAESVKERRMTLGYIIDAAPAEKAFDNELRIMLISEDGNNIILECTENITIDAVKYKEKKSQEVLDVLRNGKAHARQLIQYALNNEGKIAEIDTIVKNSGEDPEYSLSKHEFDDGLESHWYHLGRYGHTAICTDNTLAFCIPVEGVTDEENYYVGKGANVITQSNDVYVELECYYTGENSPFVDAVIGEVKIDNYIPTDVIMYEKGVQKMDDEGEMIYEISGYSKGLSQEFILEKDVIGTNLIETFNKGDLIVVHKNQLGEINEIEKVFDAKTKSPVNWEYETETELLYIDGTPEKHNRYCAELNLSYGFVRKNYGGVIAISKTPISAISERIQTNKRLNMLYDSETDTIELVTDERIVDYETAGEGCMRAVHHMWYEDGRGLYLYN